MKRILITGKNGFIARALAKRLADFPDAYRVDFLDMKDPAWKEKTLSGYDSIVHAAGIAHISPKKSMEPLYRAVNRDMTRELGRKAKDAGVSQFVFLSSSIVYGGAAKPGVPRKISPSDIPRPQNAYGLSKLEAEKALLSLEDPAFSVAILRPMPVYGPGCKGNYVLLSRFAARFPVFPDFPNLRGAIYIESLVELVRLLIDSGDRGIFHPQDDTVPSTTDFVRQIARAHGKTMRFTRLFNPLLRLFGGVRIIRRAFGSFCYSPEMALYSNDYRKTPFPASVLLTEAARGKGEAHG